MAGSPDFSREMFAHFYIPILGGHDLSGPWGEARPQLEQRREGIEEFADLIGTGGVLDLEFLDDLVALLSALDPANDALRYPFSMGMVWYDDMPPMSQAWLKEAVSRFQAQVADESGQRAQVYALTSIGGGAQEWLRYLGGN